MSALESVDVECVVVDSVDVDCDVVLMVTVAGPPPPPSSPSPSTAEGWPGDGRAGRTPVLSRVVGVVTARVRGALNWVFIFVFGDWNALAFLVVSRKTQQSNAEEAQYAFEK